MEIEKALRNIDFFLDIDDEEIAKIATIVEVKKFDPGEKIIKENSYGAEMGFILEGEVKVDKKTKHQEDYLYTTIKSGRIFGEVSFLDSGLRTASITAITPVTIAFIRRDNFDVLFKKEPVLCYKILYKIALDLCRIVRRADNETLVLYEALLNEIRET
ncbi:MAG: cyclic nucleotide-binding domain-containing protein [Thermotogae bacterium]|nr:cyclic nucleotide-binding domain-containing protein [Thermotogota bacterium]